MISETKVDHFFPVGQFLSDGFGALFGLDRNRYSGDTIIFIRNDIPAKVFSVDDKSIESFYRVNFLKVKMAIDLF